MALRILLADDHEIVRRGVRVLLETHAGWQICGESATGPEAVAHASRLMPGVVIIDITMPGLNGIEATRRILQSSPGSEVLILSMHDSEEMVQAALQAGARAFVAKSDPPECLVAAVEALERRAPFFSPHASDALVQGYVHNLQKDRTHRKGAGLSSREIEVLQLLVEGHAAKQIASQLHISSKTVAAHRANIMRKLNATSVTDLVRYAIRRNLITP